MYCQRQLTTRPSASSHQLHSTLVLATLVAIATADACSLLGDANPGLAYDSIFSGNYTRDSLTINTPCKDLDVIPCDSKICLGHDKGLVARVLQRHNINHILCLDIMKVVPGRTILVLRCFRVKHGIRTTVVGHQHRFEPGTIEVNAVLSELVHCNSLI